MLLLYQQRQQAGEPPPSNREISQFLGVESVRAGAQMKNALRRKGCLVPKMGQGLHGRNRGTRWQRTWEVGIFGRETLEAYLSAGRPVFEGASSVNATAEAAPTGSQTPGFNLEALHDCVIVERLPEDQKVGQIIVPEMDDDDGPAVPSLKKGIVRAIGPGFRSDYEGTVLPMTIKVGDVVGLLAPNAPAQILHEGKYYFVFRDRQMMVRFKKGNAADGQATPEASNSDAD